MLTSGVGFLGFCSEVHLLVLLLDGPYGGGKKKQVPFELTAFRAVMPIADHIPNPTTHQVIPTLLIGDYRSAMAGAIGMGSRAAARFSPNALRQVLASGKHRRRVATIVIIGLDVGSSLLRSTHFNLQTPT